MSQKDFAAAIGSTHRTYLGRVHGDQPRWELGELVNIAKYNGGKVKVNVDGVDYKLTIKRD